MSHLLGLVEMTSSNDGVKALQNSSPENNSENLMNQQGSPKTDPKLENLQVLKLSDQIRELEHRLINAKNENAELKAKHKEDKRRLTALESTFDQLAGKLETLAKQVQLAGKKLSDHGPMESFSARVESSEDTIRDYSQEECYSAESESATTEAIRNLQSEIHGKEEEIDTQRKEIVKREEHVDSLEKQLSQLKETETQVKDQNSEAQKFLSEAESNVVEANEQFTESHRNDQVNGICHDNDKKEAELKSILCEDLKTMQLQHENELKETRKLFQSQHDEEFRNLEEKLNLQKEKEAQVRCDLVVSDKKLSATIDVVDELKRQIALLAPLNPMAPVYDPSLLTNSHARQERKASENRQPDASAIKRTVYVPDYSPQVTEQEVATEFRNCGKILKIRMGGYPTGDMQCAFIEFFEEDGARNARALSHIRVLPSKTTILSVDSKFLPQSEGDRERCARTIYCSNIDTAITKENVKSFFERTSGEVKCIKLITDHHRSTQIAFVEFLQPESLGVALKCNNALLGSYHIRVVRSKTPINHVMDEDERRGEHEKSKSKVDVDVHHEEDPLVREDTPGKEKMGTVENREGSFHADEDGNASLRDRGRRDIDRSTRSRTPERHHEGECSELDTDKSSSYRKKDLEKYGYGDERLNGRDDSWSDKNRDRDGDAPYDCTRDWETPLQRRGRDRADSERHMGRAGGSNDGNRTDAVKTTSNYGISIDDFDVLEIETKPFGYEREDSRSSLGKNNEGNDQTDVKTGPIDERGNTSRIVEDSNDRHGDDRNLDDTEGSRGRGQRSDPPSRAGGWQGQSSTNDSQPSFGYQESGNFNRVGSQGPKGNNRMGRGGRGRPTGRDGQQVNNMQVPMMGSHFTPLGMPPPGGLQPLTPRMSPGPGPPMFPAFFIPQYPPPVCWQPALPGVPPGWPSRLPRGLPPTMPGAGFNATIPWTWWVGPPFQK